MVMRTEANGHLDKHLENSRNLDIPVEEWDEARILEKLPIYSMNSYAPPRRIDDPAFGKTNGNRIGGALYWPNGGYVTDPALSSQNMADAAKQHGAEFRLGAEVVEILQEDGRVTGVNWLRRGDPRQGGCQCRRPRIGSYQRPCRGAG